MPSKQKEVCGSCRNGFNGRSGNGYQPCSCSKSTMTILECYQEAINNIDDYFEYRNESIKDRAKVHDILEDLTKKLAILLK